MENLAMRSPRRPSGIIGLALGITCSLLLLLGLPLAADQSYGFIRTVDGSVDLVHSSSRSAIEATSNYPIQVGDQLRVPTGGHLEAVLPDASVLRLDGNTELKFARIAASKDSADNTNLLHLLQGQIQIAMVEEPAATDEYRVDTANCTIYLHGQGSYRIFTDGKSWTQVIVRSGVAEVVTEQDSVFVAPGQQALVDGDREPRISREAAAPVDGLEQWGDRLATQAQVPFRRGYIAPTLSYAAAPLYRHGRWMSFGGSSVWRPHVSTGWRPYHSGWWIYTPSGLTWISTEPWGWVTYHYGNWNYAAGLGWVWHPGHTYTPGAVRWYWGPTHVGWTPIGFQPAYPPYGAGGLSSHWRNWTFCTYDKFGYRYSHQYLETGAELLDQGVFQNELPRGILTTDTRALTPNLWTEPDRLLETLRSTRAVDPRADRQRPRHLRPTYLSPLGAAAMSSSDSNQLVRQWDPDRWRRRNLSRPQPVGPSHRDSRLSGTSSIRRSWDESRSPRARNRGGLRSTGRGRPVRPGFGVRTPRTSRPTATSPRNPQGQSKTVTPGRLSGRGRTSVGTSGRRAMSGRAGSSRGTSRSSGSSSSGGGSSG